MLQTYDVVLEKLKTRLERHMAFAPPGAPMVLPDPQALYGLLLAAEDMKSTRAEPMLIECFNCGSANDVYPSDE